MDRLGLWGEWTDLEWIGEDINTKQGQRTRQGKVDHDLGDQMAQDDEKKQFHLLN